MIRDLFKFRYFLLFTCIFVLSFFASYVYNVNIKDTVQINNTNKYNYADDFERNIEETGENSFYSDETCDVSRTGVGQ